MLEICVLTVLELNWNKRLGHKKTKLNICHHILTSSTQLQSRSFHVVERTRTSSKCQKMKYARAKRAKILFSIVKYANLWGFCCRRRRGCLSSLLKIDCRNAKLHFQMTFSLPSPSCFLKLPSTIHPMDSTIRLYEIMDSVICLANGHAQLPCILCQYASAHTVWNKTRLKSLK